ncbi:hypothetical protein DZ860_00230 [Vibrio sinensis]|uniref:Uncharacterized protein n=1 Tax=Vibrio sinensis TaxID=2302434 RepID=A0A3A6REP8_9VIBR|nr:hypothetical protein [Vibrio sinensis]RJX75151.1 hypothetical protein DZ860_00230 [Vibrio sinensis]
MREFEVLERCDHYFRCCVDGDAGKHCRILIDVFSQDLPLGKHRLHVEEISDKYKHYAMDAVFKLTLPFAEQHSIAICTLNAGKKNNFTYKACVKLGGKWEPILGEWVFSASVQDRVEQLGQIVHSPVVLVEVKFKETISQPSKSLTLFGFELVKGLNINHTPILHRNVVLKKGDITYIPGLNSKSIILADSVLRLPVPKLMLESPSFKEDYLCVTEYKIVKR